MVDWSVLSYDLKICYIIKEYQERKEGVYFTKLVDELKNDMSRSTVSKTLNKLFDLGIIDGTWEKVDDKWIRVFRIAGEAEDLINKIYTTTERPKTI